MGAAVLLVLALLSVVSVPLLLRVTVRRLGEQRAGRAYELETDYRSATRSGIGTLAAVVCAAGLLPAAVGGLTGGSPGDLTAGSDGGRAEAALAGSGPSPVWGPYSDGAAASGDAAPSAQAFEDLGEVGEGRLYSSVRPDGSRVHVWLPPQYLAAGERRAFPVLVVRAPEGGGAGGAADGSDPGAVVAAEYGRASLAEVREGGADPFVIAVVDHPGEGPACAALDHAGLRAALGAHFRVLGQRTAWAIAGAGAQAACAVRDAVDHVSAYRAAVGMNGSYPAVRTADDGAPGDAAAGGAAAGDAAAGAPGDPRDRPLRILLAWPVHDDAAARSARAAAGDLRGVAGVRLFTSSAPAPAPETVPTAETLPAPAESPPEAGPPAGDRSALLQHAFAYLTEHLDEPAEVPGG
ncbi:hypothetical protein [Allostreptomyces psammosilenae]|uniref:Esterase n=1 Tax=Allostreptomyces psammosilenae TaxID=1892865 RepID=A0A852ZY36_9ACTN|nr:hypothetical protein [Allostreptomyces psammosilenae]NYI05634.1 hypothetical protein [Allostreptomyces psammosilenae]